MVELCEDNKCTGCWACLNICPESCITMINSDEGFIFPRIDHNSCVSCGLCQKACPIITPINIIDEEPKAYASWILDDDIRKKSTSGGMFTVIANSVIDKQGFVYGAKYSNNWDVIHSGTNTKEGLNMMRGSKYVQSEIGLIYREIRNHILKGKQVLFTGAPCQVAGLINFLDPKYHELLITMDFVCHGVPSPKLFENYLKRLPNQNFEDFSFRNLKGWKPEPIIKYNGKWKFLKRSDNIYFRLFFKGFTVRESCYQCPYATISRVSDFTLADYWGLGKDIPFNGNTDNGVSLLLVNSKRATILLKEVEKNCFLEERPLGEAKKGNGQLNFPTKRPDFRDQIYSDFFNLTFSQLEEKYIFPVYPKHKVILKKVRRALFDFLK